MGARGWGPARNKLMQTQSMKTLTSLIFTLVVAATLSPSLPAPATPATRLADVGRHARPQHGLEP